MNRGAIVVDCAGVKTRIVSELSECAKGLGIRFVGGHPMAGIEKSGYRSSFAELFDGASMILCKEEDTDFAAVNELSSFFMDLGFGSIKISTAREHDEIIAYTSQLAHIASSAYIRSETLDRRHGFSAGSLKDLTRVAKMDEELWTALFFENRGNLLKEAELFIEHMQLYRNALESKDKTEMKELLRSGTQMKLKDEEREQACAVIEERKERKADIKKITISTKSGKYPVIIGAGLDFGELTLKIKKPCRTVIVSDDNVFPLYGHIATESFLKSGFRANEYVITNGEASKTLQTAEKLLDHLAKTDLTRGDLVVCLGGGVVGDIGGFVSAVYLRGIDFIQIPTTILAAVDSSVGGKTGVDINAGKNLVGAFHQPIAVFCDTELFSTLPKNVSADGMAEVIKHGMVFDRDMLVSLGSLSIEEICRRNVEIKARIVERDEFDRGERMKLNFGHTIGHAVEALSGFRISHGSAVAIGMMVVSRASEKSGLCEEPVLGDITGALELFDLPSKCEYSAKEITGVALRDKKRFGDTITPVIPKRVGHAELYEMPAADLESFIAKGLE